jgi:hypothetical protein
VVIAQILKKIFRRYIQNGKSQKINISAKPLLLSDCCQTIQNRCIFYNMLNHITTRAKRSQPGCSNHILEIAVPVGRMQIAASYSRGVQVVKSYLLGLEPECREGVLVRNAQRFWRLTVRYEKPGCFAGTCSTITGRNGGLSAM